ncbi:response regulator [Paraburkholderia sp. RAU6.4a]|uniref:response regulator n=1 Tax=Paraburkholderia sp. RAU6.4a TaxID=2991067 RepID=UPI003D1D2E13
MQSIGYSTQVFPLATDYLAARTSHLRTQNGVLISDIRMPGMSGVELLDRLVALGAAPPTIFVSAFPSDGCICGGAGEPGCRAPRQTGARGSLEARARQNPDLNGDAQGRSCVELFCHGLQIALRGADVPAGGRCRVRRP